MRQKVYSYTIKYRRKLLPDDNNDGLPEMGPHSIRSALDSPCLWVCPWALDDSKLPELCRNLQGLHNFRVFVHKHDRDKQDNHVLSVDRICVDERHIVQTAVGHKTQQREEEKAPIVLARLEFHAKGFSSLHDSKLGGLLCRCVPRTRSSCWLRMAGNMERKGSRGNEDQCGSR